MVHNLAVHQCQDPMGLIVQLAHFHPPYRRHMGYSWFNATLFSIGLIPLYSMLVLYSSISTELRSSRCSILSLIVVASGSYSLELGFCDMPSPKLGLVPLRTCSCLNSGDCHLPWPFYVPSC